MKAAVLTEYGKVPEYLDYKDPKTTNDQQIIVNPVASSIKRLDIGKAAGKHYTNFDPLPAVMGMDGVAKTDEGKLVFSMGLSGMMAEKAIVDKNRLVDVPADLDPAIAAAMPNVLMGSDVALTVRGNISDGDVVLVNGATGSTGTMAVQMAKYRGASKVIATGRNADKLESLKKIGADEIVVLSDSEAEITQQIKKIYDQYPISIVVDYLWGKPAEMILSALGQIQLARPLKFITIGQMAGPDINISSQLFRSRDLALIGSGIGSFEPIEFEKYLQTELPKLFRYAAAGKLELDVNIFKLDEISEAWNAPGRPVILI